MKVVKFNKNNHFAPFVECLVARKAYVPTLSEIPKLGYAAFEGSTLLAAVFLRRVEGGYGQIDGLMSNVAYEPHIRHAAIDAVVSTLLRKAKKLNVNKVMMMSEDIGTIERSQKYGFKKSPLSVMVADLANWST